MTEKTTSPAVMRKYWGICQAMWTVLGWMSVTALMLWAHCRTHTHTHTRLCDSQSNRCTLVAHWQVVCTTHVLVEGECGRDDESVWAAKAQLLVVNTLHLRQRVLDQDYITGRRRHKTVFGQTLLCLCVYSIEVRMEYSGCVQSQDCGLTFALGYV